MERKTDLILISVYLVLLIAGSVLGHEIGLKNNTEQTTSPDVRLEFAPKAGGSSLIHYRTDDRGSMFKWTNILQKFMEPYHKGRVEDRVRCSFSTGPPPDKVCDVPVDEFYPCVSVNEYNYRNSGPCVFIKLNEILNWQPQPYNSTEGLPEDLPIDLRQHIRVISGHPYSNLVWVSCVGESPADVENIGPIQYIPTRGFPAYYFPHTGKDGYLSPLVAVLFEKPVSGVIINIVCRAWAKNIVFNRDQQLGMVRFELMVDRY